jgi:hypothetical protein
MKLRNLKVLRFKEPLTIACVAASLTIVVRESCCLMGALLTMLSAAAATVRDYNNVVLHCAIMKLRGPP